MSLKKSLLFVAKIEDAEKDDSISSNEFNLNIPRYVDTFEEDELVDIEAVAFSIEKVNKNIIVEDIVLSDFCAELGIKAVR